MIMRKPISKITDKNLIIIDQEVFVLIENGCDILNLSQKSLLQYWNWNNTTDLDNETIYLFLDFAKKIKFQILLRQKIITSGLTLSIQYVQVLADTIGFPCVFALW